MSLSDLFDILSRVRTLHELGTVLVVYPQTWLVLLGAAIVVSALGLAGAVLVRRLPRRPVPVEASLVSFASGTARVGVE